MGMGMGMGVCLKAKKGGVKDIEVELLKVKLGT
jgi:hypothetical protein